MWAPYPRFIQAPHTQRGAVASRDEFVIRIRHPGDCVHLFDRNRIKKTAKERTKWQCKSMIIKIFVFALTNRAIHARGRQQNALAHVPHGLRIKTENKESGTNSLAAVFNSPQRLCKTNHRQVGKVAHGHQAASVGGKSHACYVSQVVSKVL